MNPLLATAEYDLVQGEKEGSRRRLKKEPRIPVSKLVNPFLVIPEYEAETPAQSAYKKIGKKRKLDFRNNGQPTENGDIQRLQKLLRKGSSMRNGGPQGVTRLKASHEKGRLGPEKRTVNSEQTPSNFSGRRLQSRCLETFSRNTIDGKESKKQLKYKRNGKQKFEKGKSRCDYGRQSGSKANLLKEKRNRRPAKDASNKLAKPLPNHARDEQMGPITWGLSSSSWGTSESLSLDGIGGFTWDATPEDFMKIASNNNGVAEEESEESDNEVVVKGKKLTPSEKRAKALEEEKNMKRKEKELIESEDNPQSPDHFERLLIGSPNSAELWIKYMGYHAVNADIEKARAVAQRAIKRIDPQLTSARLDVWIAFLNLDFTFSPPDVFKETFSEAIRCNDDYAINSRVLNLYAEAKKVSEVDQLANTMVRKYKDSLENWLQCQNALMMVGIPDKARYMLQKALTVLNKKSHVTLISRFALLENRYGFSEQAEALFENLLTSFPQRVDLLNVYVDMLVKSNCIDLARSILERASNNHLPVRKMKAIYTKWIAFEEAHGTPSDVSKVEEAAHTYVSRVLKPHAASLDNSASPMEQSGNMTENYDSGESPDLEEVAENDESD